MRTALADGWGGSMLATDISDILFGTPVRSSRQVNLGVLKEDEVNIVVHGHEPTLSEMIVAAAHDPELIDYAKTKGAKGINLAGICCTANEILMRQGVPSAGNFLHQELAIITGAVEAMVVDVQCIMQALADLAEKFHTKIITTSPKVKITGATHIEFDEHHALDIAKEIVRRRSTTTPTAARCTSPTSTQTWSPASRTSTSTTCWAAPTAASFRPLNDAIMSGRIRGVAADVGCNNPRVDAGRSAHARRPRAAQERRPGRETGCGAIACGQVRLPAGPRLAGVGRPGPARSLRGDRHPAGAAHGLLRGQQPHPDRADPDGHRRRAGRRHQRHPGRGHRPGVDEREGAGHRLLLRRLRRLRHLGRRRRPVEGSAKCDRSHQPRAGKSEVGGKMEFVSDPEKIVAEVAGAHRQEARRAQPAGLRCRAASAAAATTTASHTMLAAELSRKASVSQPEALA